MAAIIHSPLQNLKCLKIRYKCTKQPPEVVYVYFLHVFIFLHVNKVSCCEIAFDQIHLLIYYGFHIAFNTVQVISRRVVGRAEETSTYSWSTFCTGNC